ncbi:hypothetical protein GF357_03275 [Candidatus Dojkabacteria bacterium]|nr:hypothetical protein [Candidatus Dojkabacteria bacterium]
MIKSQDDRYYKAVEDGILYSFAQPPYFQDNYIWNSQVVIDVYEGEILYHEYYECYDPAESESYDHSYSFTLEEVECSNFFELKERLSLDSGKSIVFDYDYISSNYEILGTDFVLEEMFFWGSVFMIAGLIFLISGLVGVLLIIVGWLLWQYKKRGRFLFNLGMGLFIFSVVLGLVLYLLRFFIPMF